MLSDNIATGLKMALPTNEIVLANLNELVFNVIEDTEIENHVKINIIHVIHEIINYGNSSVIEGILSINTNFVINCDNAHFTFKNLELGDYPVKISWDIANGVELAIIDNFNDKVLYSADITDYETTELKDNYLGCFIECASSLCEDYNTYQIF